MTRNGIFKTKSSMFYKFKTEVKQLEKLLRKTKLYTCNNFFQKSLALACYVQSRNFYIVSSSVVKKKKNSIGSRSRPLRNKNNDFKKMHFFIHKEKSFLFVFMSNI